MIYAAVTACAVERGKKIEKSEEIECKGVKMLADDSF